MAHGPPLGWERGPGVALPATSLHLLGAPACPQQPGSFISGQPALARRSFLWQRHANVAVMQPLLGVVADSRPQVLKIASGAPIASASGNIGGAGGGRYIREGLPRPPAQQPFAPLPHGFWVRLRRPYVTHVDQDHVRDGDVMEITVAAGRLVLFCDVGGEGCFSPCAIISAAASGVLSSTVKDDPGRGVCRLPAGVSPCGAEPQAGSFGGTRHSRRISSMACRVV